MGVIYYVYRDERKLSMYLVMVINLLRVYFVYVLRVIKEKCLNGEKILNIVIVIYVFGLGLYFRFF